MKMDTSEKLRDMLDQRGIPHRDQLTIAGHPHTSWRDKNYREVKAVDCFDRGMLLFHGNLTPEQAVSVTVGDIDTPDEQQYIVKTCHLNKIYHPLLDMRRCDNCWNVSVYDNKHEPIVCPYCGYKVVDKLMD